MSVDSTSEIGLFHAFLIQASAEGSLPGSLDDAVQEFRRQQRELDDLKSKLRIGLEQCYRGEVNRIDAATIKEQLRQRLASEIRGE
jgi:hypothetical protein